MFYSAHTHAPAGTIIATMALTASFVIAGASRVAAELRLEDEGRGVATASGTANVEDATALQGPEASKETAKKKALVGSWLETVTFPSESGRPPLKSLVTFHGDETMVYSDQGNVTMEPPTIFSSGNGVWTHLEKRTFAFTSLGLISDLSGNLLGYLKVRGTFVVSDSGNEYSGTSFAAVLDADGNLLFPVIEVTNAGQRIQVELP